MVVPGITVSHDSSQEASPSRDIPQFEYDGLPKSQYIRLIKLEPGVWDSPIRCSLESCNLGNDTISYEAISYVWGTSPERKEIICDGQHFGVTTGLFDALQTFRQPDQPRTLWADAICINQKDTQERNHQVKLMRIIYSKAAKVLIWLGHEHPDTVRSGLDTVCRFVNETCSEAKRDGALAEYTWSDQGARSLDQSILLESTEVEEIKSLSQLFACTWFTRLWVVQEVVLSSAATVHWGSAIIDFRWLGLFAFDIGDSTLYPVFRLHNYSDFGMGSLNCSFIYYLQRSLESQSFYYIMKFTQQFNVSDPRDRIFGLLGLYSSNSDPDQENLFLKPNYNLSLSEVMEDVTTRLLLDQQEVLVFSEVRHGRSVPDDRTSWMPDWNNTNYSILGDGFRNTTDDVLPNICRPTCDFTNCLTINGIAVENIQTIMNDKLDQFNHIEKLEISFAILLKTLSERLQEEHGCDTVAYTLTAGSSSEGGIIDDHCAHLADFNGFLAWDLEQLELVDGNIVPTLSGIENSETIAATKFLIAVGDVTFRRQLFTTTKGHLGLGPEAMQEGDLVTVLFGGSVPFILRPVSDDHYRLVGECYFHPVMEGQAIEEWKKSGEPAKEFHIY